MDNENLNCDRCGRLVPRHGGQGAKVAGKIRIYCGPDCMIRAGQELTTPPAAITAANAAQVVTVEANGGNGVTRSRTKKIDTRPRETDISKAIADLLDRLGIWNTRTQSGQVKTAGGYMRLCRSGTPDRFFLFGLNVWIEIKRPGEMLTPDQVTAHGELRLNGTLVFTVDDVDQVRTILAALELKAEHLRRLRNQVAGIQAFVESKLMDAKLKKGRAK